jgi:hypothetical protein
MSERLQAFLGLFIDVFALCKLPYTLFAIGKGIQPVKTFNSRKIVTLIPSSGKQPCKHGYNRHQIMIELIHDFPIRWNTLLANFDLMLPQ